MAESILQCYLKESGLAARVISRGLAAPIGRAPHPNALAVAGAHAVQIDPGKRAAEVTSSDIAIATVVFVMDGEHRREVQRRFPTAAGKTFLLGQWQSQEIADPINQPLSAFEAAWRQIDAGAQTWIERLKESGIIKPECLV